MAGISSLFQPSDDHQQHNNDAGGYQAAEIPDSQSSISIHTQHSSSSSSLPTTNPLPRTPTDPYYNPPFFNDNPFKEAPFVKRFVKFVNKHKAEGLVNATAKHVLSHLEYGGCLADYPGLNRRYSRIRALEDVDELNAIGEGNFHSRSQAKVRFVNYYTLCSGRKKAPKTPSLETSSSTNLATASSTSIDDDSALSPRQSLGVSDSSVGETQVGISIEDPSGLSSSGQTPPVSRSVSPVSVSDPRSFTHPTDGNDEQTRSDSITPEMSRLSMQDIEPIPISEADEKENTHRDSISSLPPIPDEPTKPVMPDLSQYTEKEARKQAERESRRLRKAYEQAVKDRERSIRERQKMVEKQHKKAGKELERQGKEALEERWRQEKEAADAAQLQPPESSDRQSHLAKDDKAPEDKKKKNRKFCTLPRKVNGSNDPTWVDVYLDGLDEVGAHCGLFFPGSHYEKLIGDVSSRIVDWVHDDMTKRAILELQ